MERIVTQFATAPGGQADLFGSLGIDWKLLILQTVAFLILLAILRKWVYPPLVAMLDKREKDMRTAEKAAQSARDNADKAEKMTNELMRKARAEASEIVQAAREEASQVVSQAADKAKAKAEAIVQAAQDDIAKEAANARQALRDETLKLVAEAAGTVLGRQVDAKLDAKVIAAAVKEAR